MSGVKGAERWIDLSGKVAHVTGGGKGIGRGIAQALAMAGAKVMVSDINLESAESTAAEIDGAAMALLMTEKKAEQLGVEPMGYFRGFTVAGCEPDEMDIGPVFAIPKLLQ